MATKTKYKCDQEIQPRSILEDPHPCGWESGAEDFDDPRFGYGKPYCPRCGFLLPEPEESK